MDQNQRQGGDAGEAPQQQGARQSARGGPRVLGFAMDELADLTVDQIVGDKPAVTMILHYYNQFAEENAALKNERNTLATYVDNFKQKRTDSRVAAALAFLSSIFIALGINLLTSDVHSPVGYIVTAPGILTQIFALYFSLRGGGEV